MSDLQQILQTLQTNTTGQVQDYAALRSYPGPANVVQVTGILSSLLGPTGQGIAGTFIRDDGDTTSAENNGTIIVASNGKRWKRVFSGPASIHWFSPLMTGSGASEDWTTALQTLVNSHYSVILPHRTLNYRVTSPVSLRSGQRMSGDGLIFRDDQNNHILSIVSQSDIIITGLSFSHNYFMVGDRSTYSAVYSLQSSNVKVTNCNFKNIGLFAVSTDVSGDSWVITNNQFNSIAGTAYDARGGSGHLVSDNLIVNTGDDAIDVANTPGAGSKKTLISNNVIINPGQIKIGGGGIRVNSAGAVVANNQIYNANMYFVCVAALSTDGTIKPHRVVIEGNVGYGIKPTTNNTTGCVMVKNSGATGIYNNDFDPVGDAALAITNVVNNGSGGCRYTVANHGFTTSNVVRVSGVGGVTAANGSSTVTVIDANTFDITGFTFSGTYTSGGTVWNAISAIRAYSGDNTPTQNSLVIAKDNKFSRVENILRVAMLGLDKFQFVKNWVDTYNAPTLFSDTSAMSEYIFSENRLLNGNTGMFDGVGAGIVSITSLIMNDNNCTPAVLATVPINFNLATVTRAEILRNKLNGAGDRTAPTNIVQFVNGANVATMFFDGDHSGTRYNQGVGTIAQGATTSSAISHACALIDGQAQQPKTMEIKVDLQLGSTTSVLVQPTQIFSTTFVAATPSAAPSGGIAFSWRLAPVVQRYVNGVLSS